MVSGMEEVDMARALIARVRPGRLRPRGDAGQGTMEYVGMLVAVALVVAGVIAALRGVDISGAVRNAFSKAFG